jgi:hypothetical protein
VPGAEGALLEADLDLIISTFEKGMVKSRDIDSPFVVFKSLIRGMSGPPESMLGIGEGIPRPGGEVRSDIPPTAGGIGAPGPASAPGVDEIAGTAPVVVPSATPSTDKAEKSSEDDSSLDKLEDWLQDCVPCDFRTWGKLDADFFKDLGAQWEDTLQRSWDQLTRLEDMLGDASDASFVAEFCNLGNALKGQCGPDLQKLLFSLAYMLTRMELDVSVDLGAIDNLLMQALNPIINEMMANIDIIDELALGPIRCVIDQMRYQAQQGPRRFQETNNQLAGMFQTSQPAGTGRRTEAERAAEASIISSRMNRGEDRERRRREREIAREQEAERARRVAEQEEAEEENRDAAGTGIDSARQARDERDRPGHPQRALDQVSSDLSAVSEELDLDRLTGYVQKAVSIIKDYKDWLLRVLQETIDYPLDQWNRHTSFAQGKRDILQYIALIRGIIDAAKSGKFSCGSDSDTMTEDELRILVDMYRHPSERLEVRIEGANITVRRNPSTDIPPPERAVRTGVDGPDARGPEVENVIARRPISSCLKKVTMDEAAQVAQWIRQLEG